MQTLVAAGMVAPSSIAPLMPGLNLDDARYLQRIIDRERATDLAHQEEAAGYARRIEAAALAGRLHAH
jgi:hypothetical protein